MRNIYWRDDRWDNKSFFFVSNFDHSIGCARQITLFMHSCCFLWRQCVAYNVCWGQYSASSPPVSQQSVLKRRNSEVVQRNKSPMSCAYDPKKEKAKCVPHLFRCLLARWAEVPHFVSPSLAHISACCYIPFRRKTFCCLMFITVICECFQNFLLEKKDPR